MDTNSVNQIIDKLAEKLGIAVEKVTPLAEEYIRQIQTKGMICVIFGVTLLLLALVLWGIDIYHIKRGGKENWGDEGRITTVILLSIANVAITLSVIFILFHGLVMIFAPYTRILG